MPIDESPTVSPRFARARAAQLGAASAAALMRERALTLEREEDPKAMAFFSAGAWPHNMGEIYRNGGFLSHGGTPILWLVYKGKSY